MSNAQELINLILVTIIFLVILLMILAVVYMVIKIKGNKKEESEKIYDTNNSNTTKSDARKVAREYTQDSIFKFMEFDKVQDSMIVQKNGNRFLMVIECMGINYDLMSEAEKVSVEQNFLQFLNTLRHPIQIYIQTRTINLNDSINGYMKKVQEVESQLLKKKMEYNAKLENGGYSKQELDKEYFELTKLTNLYEYGKDIIANTQRMSLNKNVLNKKYYIIIPCYPRDLVSGAFDKEEMKNLAFQELYTKSKAIINTLLACGVNGKILKSNELIELLYMAYNRDEAEVFAMDTMLKGRYDELYTTAPDVLDKKMKILNQEIENKAVELMNEKVVQVKNKKQQELEEKEARFGEIIRKRAQALLRQNALYIGREDAEQAIQMIEEDKNLEPTKEEGGDANVGEEKKPKTRGRKPKVAKQ